MVGGVARISRTCVSSFADPLQWCVGVTYASGHRDGEGRLLTDVVSIRVELRGHWAPVFADTGGDNDEIAMAGEFLNYVVIVPSAGWELAQAELQAAAQETTDRCPGPDGLPYAAWCRAPEIMWATLGAVRRRSESRARRGIRGGSLGGDKAAHDDANIVQSHDTWHQHQRGTEQVTRPAAGLRPWPADRNERSRVWRRARGGQCHSVTVLVGHSVGLRGCLYELEAPLDPQNPQAHAVSRGVAAFC